MTLVLAGWSTRCKSARRSARWHERPKKAGALSSIVHRTLSLLIDCPSIAFSLGQPASLGVPTCGEYLQNYAVARGVFIGMLAEGTDTTHVTDSTGTGPGIHAHEEFDIDVGMLLAESSQTAWMQPMMDAQWMKAPGRSEANMIQSKASLSLQKTTKKKKGPRFKYLYDSAEQAAEARRQRNRAAALRSYHRKREYTARMEAEVAELEREHAELLKLLDEVTAGTVVDIQGMADVERYLTPSSL